MKMNKVKWGVVVGRMTKAHPNYPNASLEKSLKGQWMMTSDPSKPIDFPELFDTREKAREKAKEHARYNTFWKYHAKKYDPSKKHKVLEFPG